MALNPLLLIAPSLEMLFRDKSSGLPLANGVVYFWRDQSRTIPKPVYQLVGTPADYEYSALPNPVILTSVGTFSDGAGNDIIPYYFPYLGTPDTVDIADAVLDLYFIEVYSAGGKATGVLQWTRQAWPNAFVNGGEIVTENLENFIPDGQFWIHNDVPDEGLITQPLTYLSQGGWSFQRKTGSAAVDNVTFSRFNSYTTNPTLAPRYAVNIIDSTPDPSETKKDLVITFDDVNTFSSAIDQFTFYFSASSGSVATFPVSLYVVKYFGSGASSGTVSTLIKTFTITPGYNPYQANFVFGSNAAFTLGPNDDDTVSLALRCPLTSAFNLLFTDFLLTLGNLTITSFPYETIADMKTRSVAGWMNTPAYDGSDLYLPLRLTPKGMEFDTTQISEIVALPTVNGSTPTPPVGMLYCDGSSFDATAYSPDGIPYRRLQQKLMLGSPNFNKYGNGANFVNSFGVNNSLWITTNSVGSVPIAADGTVPTGFTFSKISSGNASNFGIFSGRSFISSTFNHIIFYNLANGKVAATRDGAGGLATGFTFTELRAGLDPIASPPGTFEVSQVDTIVATTLAGKYFLYNTPGTAYYVWYKVNGSGADPAPSGTGIEVDLLSTDNQDNVAFKTMLAINAFTSSNIVTKAASTLTGGGQYFTFNTTGPTQYYVWYFVNNAGTDPAPVGRTGIEVILTGTETDAQVASATSLAINSRFFAVPDYRGAFLRGYDPTNINDLGPRFSVTGNFEVGTTELDSNLVHNHETIDGFNFVTNENSGTGTVAAGTNFRMHGFNGAFTYINGAGESVPYNVSVAYFIRY